MGLNTIILIQCIATICQTLIHTIAQQMEQGQTISKMIIKKNEI